MTSPVPATEPDTTTGGGNPLPDPNPSGQVYEAPPEPFGVPVAGTVETDDISGGTVHTGIGRTGNTDAGAHNPVGLGTVYTASNGAQVVSISGGSEFDTTVNAAIGGIGVVGDTDSHSHDPAGSGFVDSRGSAIIDQAELSTSVLGGGIGAANTGQAYRAPVNDVPATNFDTASRSGIVRVEPGSPDSAAVGSGSGLNPNAIEPGFTNAAYDVMGTRDTTYANSPTFTAVPLPAGVPTAPTAVTVTAIANRAAVTVSWTAPSNAVATGVVGYIIESNTLGQTEVGKNQTSVEFEQGLIPGDTYTFTVFARTSNGTGVRSAKSAPFTVAFDKNLTADVIRDEGLSGPADQLPVAPAAPVATVASTTSVSVAFTAPTSDGGSPITGYEVVSSPGGITVDGTASPIVVTGLTHLTAYTFTVRARNGYGLGPASAASNSVTP